MDVIMILITEPHKVCPFYEVIQEFMNYVWTLLEFHENLSFFKFNFASCTISRADQEIK